MSAGFGLDIFGNEDGEIIRRCSVVSIYEDRGGRDLLFELRDLLTRKFKGDVDFQFDWWRFKYLADPEIAMKAAQSAAQADLILFAPQSSDLPIYVQGWFEDWLPFRKTADGALVLVQNSAHGAVPSLPLGTYLRLTAKRARLDYFTLFQPELINLPTDDDPPLHWGINE